MHHKIIDTEEEINFKNHIFAKLRSLINCNIQRDHQHLKPLRFG